MKTITGNCYSSDSINVKQLILLTYCLNSRGKSGIFFNRLLMSHLCFDSRILITFLVGLFLRAVGKKHIFLFGRFMACNNTYLMQNFKIICQGEVGKTEKQVCLSKLLKVLPLEKMEMEYFFQICN